MIRRFFLKAVCVAAALAVVPVGQAAAQDAADATPILKKALEAAGGAEAIKKFPAMKDVSKGSMEIQGAELTFTATSMMMTPDKLKFDMKMSVLGMTINAVQVMNGDKIRAVANGMDQPIDDAAKAELKSGLEMHRMSMIYPLLEGKDFKVKLLEGKKKVEGSDAFVVSVTGSDKKEVKIFFDEKTYLITKMEKRGLNGEQAEGNQEIFISDYKKVEGIMVPTKTKILHEGKRFMETTTTEVKLLEKIDAKEFDISD
jgi:zinc protease